VTNLVCLLSGIFQSRSVQMNLRMRKVSIAAMELSLVSLMGRSLSNETVSAHALTPVQLLSVASFLQSVRMGRHSFQPAIVAAEPYSNQVPTKIQ
jgi:hypothetical protein